MNGRRPATTRVRATGFTLLELILAAGISAAIGVALFTATSVAFRARTSAANQTQAMREAAIILDIVRQDLESVGPHAGTLGGAFVGTSSGSVGAESATLEFHALGREAGRKDDDPFADGHRRIEFGLRSDGQTTCLVRRVQPNLLAQVEPEPVEEVLAANVRSLAVRYYDGETWTTEWDSANQGDVLPLAVELTLRFDLPSPTDASRAYEVTQVIPVLCGQEATSTETGVSGG